MELLTDEEIGRWVAERDEMRRKGNFTRADEIRQNLQKAGVILEDSKARNSLEAEVIMSSRC